MACWPAAPNSASIATTPAFSNSTAVRRVRSQLLPDHVIEIDNKSLTHRPDLWGHHGMAREVAAITGKTLLDPVDIDRCRATIAPVTRRDRGLTTSARATRALVFENVTVQPSPLWLQYRLEAIGLNPINNIVDVTNFVMAEFAQPMHAFDADKLQRRYDLRPPGASRRTIPGAERRKVRAEPIESRDRRCRRADRPRRRHRRRSTARSRNDHAHRARERELPGVERPQDLVGAEAAHRCLHAIREGAGSRQHRPRPGARHRTAASKCRPGIRLVGGLADAWKPPPAPPPIVLPLDWLDRKLGRDIRAGRSARRFWNRSQFGVDEAEPGVFSVTVPIWRATKDVSIKDDLVEEVGRMIGYEFHHAACRRWWPATVPPANEERAYHHRVRDTMAAQGFTEVYNYSFVSEEMAARFELDPAWHVVARTRSPSDQNLLRQSLLPGIWKNIARQHPELRLVPPIRNRAGDPQTGIRTPR